MPNVSKVAQKRCWNSWRMAGAVQNLAMGSDHKKLLVLAKKAFAAVVRTYMLTTKPLMNEVKVMVTTHCIQCIWTGVDSSGRSAEAHGSFYHDKDEGYDDGTVCMVSVRRGGCCTSEYLYEWYFMHSIAACYEPLANCLFTLIEDGEDGEPSDQDILDWSSNEMARHSRESEELHYHLEWFFKSRTATKSGVTADMVEKMTTYKKIELLQELVRQDDSEGLPAGMFAEMEDLANRINKDGFRTADDYMMVSPVTVAIPLR